MPLEMNKRYSSCSIISAILIILIFLTIFAESKRHVKIHKFICESLDAEFGDFVQCNVKAIKRDVGEINVEVKLKKTLNERFMCNLFMKKRGSAQNLHNLTVDVCKFLSNRKRNPMVNLFFSILGFETYSNINHSCPLMDDLFIKGYRMEEQLISNIPVPFGSYIIGLHWFYYNKPVLRNEIAIMFYEQNEKTFAKHT